MKLIEQIVTQIKDACDAKAFTPHDFADIPEIISCLTLHLEKADLSGSYQDLQKSDVKKYKLYLQGYQKKCVHHWRPLDIRQVTMDKGLFKGFNTGGLLWGERGCGKS